jgi:hypothetical protein
MKVRKALVFPVALLLTSLSTISYQTVSSAKVVYSVNLSGSGPVYTSSMSPGQRTVSVYVRNYNNLNVGWDLIDQGNGSVISNGTIKDAGSITRNATTHAGRAYKLRLRCQEPVWNNTKCNAYGSVSW